MFAYLNKCFEKLKKDHILWVPYLFYCLFFSLVNKYVFKGLESLGIKEFFIFYLENVCQTIVGILFILMVVNLKDNSQTWKMSKDGTYQRILEKKNLISAHEYFMANPSLSGRGKSLERNKPKELLLKSK